MGKSERAFTFINTKSVGNVQRRVNKRSDMPALVKFLKHRHLKVATCYCNTVKY